jgi:hypothetical protein
MTAESLKITALTPDQAAKILASALRRMASRCIRFKRFRSPKRPTFGPFEPANPWPRFFGAS